MIQSTCERCGDPLPAGARFCPNCGFPVGLSRAGERRVVTVLFADLTSSTELAAGLDPERFREVLAAFYGVITEELESLRGRAENYVGDAVLGVFGMPHAHDDDAIRAIRAGLAIIDHTAKVGESMGLAHRLGVRIGINTGPVAVGVAATDHNLVLGAEVNLAARLQQAAAPGEVLVGETTHLLSERAVEFGPPRRISAKGFEGEVTAWPVIGLAPRAARRTIPLVDRREELGLLAGTYGRSVERERTHLVTLVGEPGIGKSRLADEFLDGLPEGTKVLAGRVGPFDEDVSFGPIAEMLARELGEERDAPAERLRKRLEDVVAGCCGPSETEQVAARLGLALGLGDGGHGEHRYRAAEVRAGLLGFLTGLVRTSPVVMVFEDLHLGDPGLLELIEQLVREARKLPLMVLCVARWDLLEISPNWAGGIPDAVTLWLEPLSPPDATQLAVEAGEGLDEDEAARIARHAGGNPFFIVETTGMLLHEAAEATPVGPKTGRLLPPTVQAVVAARLDHLGPAARDLVRKASVFFRGTFDVSELALLTEPRPEILHELQDEEILMRDPERETVWQFRHDLLRDVAYESLAKRERQRLHLRIANKLSEPETAERYPRAIAYHLEQAARAALDLDPADRTLAERAIDALAHAGHLIRSGTDSGAAVDLYERALALAGPERDWGEREAGILAELGEARYWLGDFDTAAGSLSRALELGGGSLLVKAHASRFLGDILLTVRGDRDGAARLFEQGLAAARELGDPWTLARTLLSAGWVDYHRDDLTAARDVFEEALQVARANPEKDPWVEARALVSLGLVISPVGDEEEVEEYSRQALSIGKEMDDAFTIAVAEDALGGSLRRMWRPQEALPLLDDAIRIFRELGAKWELASSLTSRGVLARVAGRLSEAERDLRDALRLCRELKEQGQLTFWAGGQLCRVLLASGEIAAARQALEEVFVQLGQPPREADEDLRWSTILLLLVEGDGEAASQVARKALEVERERGWQNDLAAETWFTGRLFGADAVGGQEELERARKILQGAHWGQALLEPDLVKA